MKKTPNLNLPIFNAPDTDTFNLEDWNNANNSIDGAYKEIVNFKEEIPKVNANAEIVEAREGAVTLGANVKRISLSLEQKLNKDGIVTMANMGQDVKTAMTGGSVAVVGKDTILTENIVNDQVTIVKTNFYNAKATNVELELGSVNAIDGSLVANENFMRSKNFIVVSPSSHFVLRETKGYSLRIIYFNNSNIVLSYQNNVKSGTSLKIPSGCTKIKISSYLVNGNNDLTNDVKIETITLSNEIIDVDYIKEASGMEKLKNDLLGEMSVISYSNKFIYYNSKDYSVNVVGEDISNDPRICVFNYNNEIYTVKGVNGDRKVLQSNTGNAWIVIDKTLVDKNNITINDFSVVTSITNTNYIVLAHLVWNSAVNSKIIKKYVENNISIELPKFNSTGEDYNFMNGMLNKNKQVFKLAYWGDSIFASGFKDLGVSGDDRYSQPVRGTNLDGIQRMTYEYLNFNKPKFRNIRHSSWSFTGSTTDSLSSVMPNNNAGGVGSALEWEIIRKMNDTTVGNTAEITITGEDTVVFVFEGGMKGNSSETGNVNIKVSVDGGDFVNPQTILKGSLNKKGYGTNKVYDIASYDFDTSFVQIESVNAYNQFTAMNEVIYSCLDKNKSYRFKIAKPLNEKDVKLWGCYYFSGQTLLVINQSKPGLSWNDLSTHVNTDLIIPKVDFVILEAPMYHDWILNTAKNNCKNLINKIKSKGIQVALCSCPPGGVIPIGRKTAILGDENGSSYWAEQHFYRYYNRFRKFITTNITTTSENPQKHDIYSVVISGITYQMECVGNNGLGQTYFNCTTDNFPKKLVDVFPLTFNKISGATTSKSSIVYTSMDEHFDMEEHRTAMLEISRELNLKFIDVFQAFVDLANSVGETLNSEGYDMDLNHPFYSLCEEALLKPTEYPSLKKPFKMNYMTNFFDVGDGHHLNYNAHEPIFELIKNQIFKNCSFKNN